MRRIHAVALGILSVTIVVAVSIAVPAIGANGGGKGLSKHDRELIAQARVDGKSTVIVMVAAKGGNRRIFRRFLIRRWTAGGTTCG